ncbi:hypothetical protein PMIN02_009317 [Paraphaeosphaeria minitans]|uniref:Alpha/beta hydrolase fold-3 domain-containing protein n=1 Tax=Paraphaeosphaeria minitans TaxID=565426 RepID=A0A9P6GRN1_9PLEO|nr:hypothetical protein PMIN01_02525 [Paraphaeosphaeria minitans]
MTADNASAERFGRPRWLLHLQAQIWRFLMGIGMMLHKLARPLPPKPSFNRSIESTVSPLKGNFKLHFYVPKDYNRVKKLKGAKRYPCVINFHGGGFVLGSALDDARWAGVVVQQVGAIVVSVDYRCAPEFPFPTAVEDGADAVLYLAQHADEFLIDPSRFAISGFSSGGNMSFTVPLCLQGELLDRSQSGEKIENPARKGSVPAINILAPPSKVHLRVPPPANSSGSRVALSRTPTGNSRLDRIAMLRSTGQSALSLVSSYKEGSAVAVATQGSTAEAKIRGIVSFYPPTDYTQTRAQRRATCSRADQLLPAVFTELFDDSYLQPPALDLSHPWLSPGVAPDAMLVALPDDIVLFCCEWDMLLAEGEQFRDRLKNSPGKRVHYHKVPGVPHGWDKAPNPLRESPGARDQYRVACRELKRMFEIEDEDVEEGICECPSHVERDEEASIGMTSLKEVHTNEESAREGTQ